MPNVFPRPTTWPDEAFTIFGSSELRSSGPTARVRFDNKQPNLCRWDLNHSSIENKNKSKLRHILFLEEEKNIFVDIAATHEMWLVLQNNSTGYYVVNFRSHSSVSAKPMSIDSFVFLAALFLAFISTDFCVLPHLAFFTNVYIPMVLETW